MVKLIDLPRFPLTEKYEPYTPEFVDRGYYDQGFLFCERCAHGKLEAIVPPAALYGEDYRTRSAGSVGSLAAIEHFAAFIRETSLDVEAVLDIGGNDASLVTRLPGTTKVVVDPHAVGALNFDHSGSLLNEVLPLKEFIEDADLSTFKGLRKLIVSSHTLEHVADPSAFFRKVREVCLHGDWLAIQVPSLEALVRFSRIDHIHHQHIHYFSRRSLGKLLAQHGFEVVRYGYDATHWGAVMVMCRKGNGDAKNSSLVPSEIERAHKRFVARMATVEIPDYEGIIGFGAALMLPVLRYWLSGLEALEYIADNDRSKDGLRYINFNKPIRSDYDLSGRDVVITAIGTRLACRELIRQAFEKGAQNVIVPLGVL